MRIRLRQVKERRRGAVVILVALMLVVLMAMVSFAIDVGYVANVQTQLQRAADSAALAGAAEMNRNGISAARTRAQQIGQLNSSSGTTITIPDGNVEFGVWDLTARTFTPSAAGQGGNAVRVTITQSPNLFFARAMGFNSTQITGQAIAIATPRDICFVIDLSGSMNDDTDPTWATTAINSQLGSTVGDTLFQNICSDFNIPSDSSANKQIGYSLNSIFSTQSKSAWSNIIGNTKGLLNRTSVASTYKISSSDSAATKKKKAYSYIIDNEIAALMPNALPAPVSSNATSYAFWEGYLDKITRYDSSAPTPADSTDASQGFNNPNRDNYPTASVVSATNNEIGPRTYIQFLLDHGRDGKVAGAYVPLSKQNSQCPMHDEATDGGVFSFPPREMPTHACRRSVIAAIATIQNLNSLNPSPDQKDWVSIVTFDKSSPGPVILQPLTSDYTAAMQATTTMQAVSDISASTATEAGMIKAQEVLKTISQGGSAREYSDKVVVVLTDGQPNIVTSSSSTISNYISANPSSNFYTGSGNNAFNAPIMQSDAMNENGWKTYAVGIGFGTDYDFLDRVARMGSSADSNGQAPRNTGDPSQYEAKLKSIFQDIIANAGVRLVN